jgi:hypothetical protein
MSEPSKSDVFCLVESDCSVLYMGKKYALTEKHYLAVSFLADQQKRGVPALSRKSVLEYAGFNDRTFPDGSVRKWFLKAGGGAEQLAKDRLIVSDGRGNCRLTVSPEFIQIVPLPGEETDDVTRRSP